jgi:hypothetical protein
VLDGGKTIFFRMSRNNAGSAPPVLYSTFWMRADLDASPTSTPITSIAFDTNGPGTGSHQREALGSENWPTTWRQTGDIGTMWGDGNGFDGLTRVSNGYARVTGGPSSYTGIDVNGGSSSESGNTKWPDNGEEGKCYGLIDIAGVLYAWITGGETSIIFDFARLYKSTNNGSTWTNTGVEFLGDGSAEDVVVPTFLQFGQGYAGARDGFVYSYFIQLQDANAALRVQKPGRIHRNRSPPSAGGDKSDVLWTKIVIN